jgi:hypothetical protein
LRDHENRSVGLDHGPIHLSLFVIEDAEPQQLARKPVGVALVIQDTNAQKDAKAALNGGNHAMGHAYLGRGDSLNDKTHGLNQKMSGYLLIMKILPSDKRRRAREFIGSFC